MRIDQIVKSVLEGSQDLPNELPTVLLSAFRLLVVVSGFVVSAEWISTDPNFSFYYLIVGIIFFSVLIKALQFGKTLPKKNTTKLLLLRVWMIVLIIGFTYGSIGSLNLLMYDGLEKLHWMVPKDGYHFWKSLGDWFFDVIFPIFIGVSTFFMKRTIKNWKNRFGPVFPSLAWI